MKPFYAPLFEALVDHVKTAPAGFHVPGHHYGHAMMKVLNHAESRYEPDQWYSAIMQLDVTELSTTDDLHHPEASIMEAQRLAAQTFGAEETFFLVGGSTSGNIALLLTLCEPGDIIIVQRNVHKSIINGLKLAGAKAVFISPEMEENSGLAIVPTVQQVEDALRIYPDAKAVFLSNPNYYGMSTDLIPFVELVHRHGKPLIVDEAHGAHYGFHPELPRSGLAAGADAVVQSAHKTLPALTMGAMLHVQGSRIQKDLLRQSLAMIQSSSPSFPILASLDISRAMIHTLGARLFEQSLASAASFRSWMKLHSTVIQVMEWPIRTANSSFQFVDPLRVVIYDNSGVMSGYELQRRLEQHGCYAEMADPRYVVLVFGIQTSLEDTMKLQYAIRMINGNQSEQAESVPNKQSTLTRTILPESEAMAISEPVSFARERFKNKSSVRVELGNAKQLISAEMVTPYPPGIAILYAGEKITTAIIKQIQHLSASGAKFQGAIDPTMSTIAVYKH